MLKKTDSTTRNDFRLTRKHISDGQISSKMSHLNVKSFKKNIYFNSQIHIFPQIFTNKSEISNQIFYGNVIIIEKSTQRYSTHLLVVVRITHKLVLSCQSQSVIATQQCIACEW